MSFVHLYRLQWFCLYLQFFIDGMDFIVCQLVIFSWDSDEDIAQLSGERCERVLCVAPQLSVSTMDQDTLSVVSTYLQSCTFR